MLISVIILKDFRLSKLHGQSEWDQLLHSVLYPHNKLDLCKAIYLLTPVFHKLWYMLHLYFKLYVYKVNFFKLISNWCWYFVQLDLAVYYIIRFISLRKIFISLCVQQKLFGAMCTIIKDWLRILKHIFLKLLLLTPDQFQLQSSPMFLQIFPYY